MPYNLPKLGELISEPRINGLNFLMPLKPTNISTSREQLYLSVRGDNLEEAAQVMRIEESSQNRRYAH